jgi:DNA helicase HerA-like ATPase
MEHNLIETILERDEASALERSNGALGPIQRLTTSLNADGKNLLGFVLDMSYDEATIVTCDAWKRKCGGVPKNSFVVIRLSPTAAKLSSGEAPRPALILARIIEAVATPLSNEVQQTIFTIHKVQAVVDPYTNAELQWGALKVAILGTYYDDEGNEIAFGNDIDSYMSPHFYEVYVPQAEDLEMLINSFVSKQETNAMGKLRYTETQTTSAAPVVEIKVSPHDFVANRTALFGKTRMGKSNTIKVIADMMLRSKENVGQVIFDLNGEYSNVNEQDNTSLYDLHREHCVRYSLNPGSRAVPGVPAPKTLKVNFFRHVELGHSIITSQFLVEHKDRPGYILPLLQWEPCDEEHLDERFVEEGDRKRYLRARSMYFAALSKAGYRAGDGLCVDMILHRGIRQRLAQDEGLRNSASMAASSTEETPEIDDKQPLRVALRAYEVLYRLHSNHGDDNKLFPPSERSGNPYFDPIHLCFLQMIGDTGVLGTRYLMPFSKYHDQNGADVVGDIVREVDSSLAVIIDLANANEVVARYYSKLVSNAVFRRQTEKFTQGVLGNHSVLFYFEEAHNLFSKDDKDLTSIYNRLAKEGAKNKIGMVYATQSMTTLSPDLLKNTENFFIAHLNDDREIRELTNRYEFRDIGLDVQRCKTRGYVRMITLSHRYALPVQINKFERQ